MNASFVTTARSLRLRRELWVAFVCASLTGMVAAAEGPSAEQVEFFEKQVRPLLLDKCISCHGSEKQQGGLRLDSLAALQKGNETGPALVAGKPADSRLIQVIQFSADDLQMPPSGKLSAEQIAILTHWVELGAPWPATAAISTAESAAAGKHWSFLPIENPAVPQVKAAGQVRDSLDAFIIAGLEQKQLTLSKPADRRTFIRRAALDLWGIPPTYEEVEAFVNDSSETAVAKLIDRLLESPLYGQRWARHWLDVARYADTKGYVFTEEHRYPYAYTYRDYVVDAFNKDKPYDRFLLEQIAADQLTDLSETQAELAALGFLTVGRRFLNRREDIIDDRIDVVTRGLMALTVSCARCHDHKYDPVPTADYYSLFGVFNSCEEPGDLPIIGTPKSRTEYEKFLKDLAEKEKVVSDYEAKTLGEIQAKLRAEIGSYLVLVIEPKAADPGAAAKALITGEPRTQVVERWKRYLDTRKDPNDRIFGAWNQLSGKPDGEFPAALQDWLAKTAEGDAAAAVHPQVRQAIVEANPKTRLELATTYGKLLSGVETQFRTLLAEKADATALADGAAEELRQVLYADGSPTNIKPGEANRVYLRNERDKHRQLVKDVEAVKVNSAGAPPRAMVLNDKARPEDPRILIRGNVGRPGDVVPRRFLEVLAGKDRQPFAKGSGRLELAQAIVAPTNPLTPRVIVNRVWQHHFGEGLVRTPGDFGIRGEVPTHPELLDHLATRFLQNGWSIKSLHRWIMNSATYAQASLDRPEARKIDPENRLLWKMPRLRLELEALRDSWLAAAGRLDLSVGGRPFESISDPNATRRTVYGFVNRNDLPGVFRSFDFADVDVSMAERPETTVPQQALFAMNSPFVIEQARQLATRVQSVPDVDDATRVSLLYRRALSREPTSEEREQALNFLQHSPHTGQLSNWDKLAQILMLTNEFAFAD